MLCHDAQARLGTPAGVANAEQPDTGALVCYLGEWYMPECWHLALSYVSLIMYEAQIRRVVRLADSFCEAILSGLLRVLVASLPMSCTYWMFRGAGSRACPDLR